ncbi:MAG: HAD family phosphatase [Candidatus Saccharimonadales bacterium]
MSRPFAVFDIDGTLIRWQLYHAIGDALAKQGIIDAAKFQQVRAARMNWKKRSSEDSFTEYEHQLIKVFDQALPGQAVSILQAAIDTVFDEYKEQVYTYTRDLIQELKAKNYLLFAVSGSPSMIVQKMADYYGFDDWAATRYAVKNGRFTGEKDLSVTKKPALLKQLISTHQADSKDSIGVGDSEGDISMLELTERPIAFNPTKQLFEHAKQQGWQIVLERKNVVYQLESRDGSYLLA